jgi:hypothetical protein
MLSGLTAHAKLDERFHERFVSGCLDHRRRQNFDRHAAYAVVAFVTRG